MRLPILGGLDEAKRLHSIAHDAAKVTGKKGRELDEVIGATFAMLVAQSNRVRARRTPALQVVEGGRSSAPRKIVKVGAGK